MRGGGFGEDMYDGVSEYGKFQALVMLVIGVVVALCVLGYGIYLLATDDTRHTATAAAKVVAVHCDGSQGCTLSVSFVVDKREFQVTLRSDKRYAVNDDLTVAYDPAAPTDAVIAGQNRKVIGGFTIAAAAIIAGGVYVTYLSTQRYKVAAAAVGASALVDTLARPFRDR